MIERKENKNIYGLSKISKWILTASFTALSFSFIAPYLLTKFSIIDFTETGEIGDTLGGIMNPFIALGGALLTYLAFYMQFKANKLQREQFDIQIENEKKQFREEIKEQNEQFLKSQFENQFYEMIRLHKENVSEISISLKSHYLSGGQSIYSDDKVSGREVFKYLLEEINLLYWITKEFFPKKSSNFLINMAYGVFFHGNNFDKKLESKGPNDKNHVDFINSLININVWHSHGNYKGLNQVVKRHTGFENAKELNFILFEGHSSHLAHYYRHLYQTVKFVANQDETKITYSEKRKYLRILRAQLSNQEQVLLFYNWKSGFGKNWENKTNRFFTDYRMIHNIYNDLLITDFNLIKLFNLEKESYYRKEPNRENDTLFEFQDW
ncbi:putative phage abortive infection protein [Tenacibaculum singaporense]|uniref:Phage abortive infection protein n=1 Tax=Tenacibaculum singaporense TaxID=2358479 RepID=A0A3Q8RMI4_9FLAO|nr:putative phage abortive infection protein [Tenacibaculum singaporense]AZJ35292.1 hypothetical protein D6T69_07060 [Tenacibaculum singaporense]